MTDEMPREITLSRDEKGRIFVINHRGLDWTKNAEADFVYRRYSDDDRARDRWLADELEECLTHANKTGDGVALVFAIGAALKRLRGEAAS